MLESIEKQKEYLKKLTIDRSESAKTLEKPSLIGVRRSIVDKYSDQAHFIYELLQNADDALATKSRFILSKDNLIFIHNGTIGFTVSNPETEDQISKTSKLGHINSITSIGNTTKDKAKIGKFGVGFKAVFQYSNSPHIYDNNFRFKIERFIVPQELKQDHPLRQQKETLFYFPFDLQTKSKEEAYSDILLKLKSLVHPVLFLTNLKEVVWETEYEKGKYTKTIRDQLQSGETFCELITLLDGLDRRHLWLFTRGLEEQSVKYSVGYFLDRHKKLDSSKYFTAFCFFPTKETTNLKFIIQAPFLLTDSREGIKAGDNWNKMLINKLSVLAAESLLILKKIGLDNDIPLIDDKIVNLIPYNPSDFTDINDRNKISFYPFYNAIKGKFQNEKLLPAKNNKYSSKNSAYWASDTELTELFSDKQLANLMEKEDAKWVFTSLGRKQVAQSNWDLLMYIDGGDERRGVPSNLIVTNLDPEKIFRKITNKFIESQSFSWLKSLYSYLIERRALWEKENSVLRNKPIFINSDGSAVTAFDVETGKNLVLFFPSESITTNQIIHKEFLTDLDSRKFFIAFGLDTPKLKDEIYNNIIPQYKNNFNYSNTFLIKQHFNSFLKYFEECPNINITEYIKELQKIEFLACKTQKGKGNIEFKDPTIVYYPTEELKLYFKNKFDVPFIDLEFYNEFTSQESLFEKFITALGINKIPIIFEFEIKGSKKDKIPLSLWTRYSRAYDKYFDGAAEIISNISMESSLLLWRFLCASIKDFEGIENFKYVIWGRHDYFYVKERTESFDSSEIIRLKESQWIYTNADTTAEGSTLSLENLAFGYDTISNEAKALMELLGVRNPDAELNLSEENRRIFALGKIINEHNLTPEYVRQLIEQDHHKQTQRTAEANNEDSDNEESPIDTTLKHIKERFKESGGKGSESKKPKEDIEVRDEDDFTKSSIDFEKRKESLTEKVQSEIEEITRIQELTETAYNSEKYSFSWFKSLLELEYLNGSGNSNTGKEISIQFSKVEMEPGTERTLILKHPNRYIPQNIEDTGDLTLRLYSVNDSITVMVEVVNVKEFTLRAKLNKSADLFDTDLADIYKAVIDIRNPIFLLDELRKNFIRLPFEDSFNLQRNLTENIEFIFGPPGTGKTTHLATKILIPLMKKEEGLKILVLTPTNKAADVLVNTIIKTMDDDESYVHWLVRFGLTGDKAIEQSPIFRDKSFDIRSKSKNVTITTIARFPYDYFQPDRLDHRLHLRELHWDFIVIDEASMIPLVNIIFPLYYKTDTKFIIAGDPFQIQPITSVSEWKDENIYTMIELDNFKNPTTIPHNYRIVNLPTQYRSIPSIGTLFSHFTYNGILENHRKRSSQKELKINGLKIEDINIIRFPVSPFETIYKAKRLNNSSSYHIYSAIFTYEFAKFISQEINRHQSETYRLGIICPYKAQATLVEKLFASGNYDSKNVTIQVGTIHGFQGDECDIVISLFNPPPIISESPRMFLNKQNILNVAISRARDYLFIIMPDENTENISCLKRIQQIVKLINLKAKDNSTEYQASRIEQVMFKKNNFIEQNSFSTTHQSVNVYSEAEVLYEIRCEETAIDIQVSRQKTKAQISIDPKLPYFKQSVIPKEEILSHSIQNGDKI